MAIPHVVALYQWLRGKPEVSLPALDDNAFGAAELEESTKQFAANKAIFVKLARLRAFKQGHDTKDLKSVWFDNSEDYEELNNFIEFIQNQTEAVRRSPSQLILNYLLLHPETAANPMDAFNTFFATWLASNSKDAIAFYEDDDIQEKLSNHQVIQFAFGRQVTLHYQQEARVLFESVTNPLGLISLFAEHYDNPQRMAAFILYLLEQGATPAKRNEIANKIFQSGLLHEFLLAHVGFMSTDDNPVTQLYRLLNTFPIAVPLVDQALSTSVKTSTEVNKAFVNYSLDGTEQHSGHEAKQLLIRHLSPILFDAVPQPTAFKPFYDLFGQRFLLNMLIYYRNSSNVGVKQILEQQFNNLSSEGVSHQALVQLLNVLARENNERLLRAVAELLEETTITALIESGNFAVFHLIPFKSTVLDKLNLAQVQRYIASLQPNDNQFDHLILLRTMLLQFRWRGDAEEVTALIFDKIINVLMANPNLDDRSLIQALHSTAWILNCKALLQQHAVLLTEQLNQLIRAMITSDAGLTPDTAQDLSSAWRDLVRQWNVLKEISPNLVSDFPHDKYAFYVRVVKEITVHQGNDFDLQATLINFFPVVEEQELLLHYPEGSVSEHERTLIELLAAINDNEGLWVQAIQQLEAPPINRSNWLEQQYSGHTLVELASKQGNNSLTQYLLLLKENNKLNQAIANHSLKTAVAAKQWDTVKRLIYLSGANKLDLDSVSEALVAATKDNQLASLLTPESSVLQNQGLFHKKRRKIELPVDRAQLLTLLVAHGEEETIKQLIQLSPPKFLHSLATRTNVTDYSGRTFTDAAPISAFGLALWAMDSQMIFEAILEPLQKAFNAGYVEADAIRQELERQYQEIQTEGVSYTLNGETIQHEHHFDFQPLIDALKTYQEQYDRWSHEECQEHWCHNVGMLQRLVPAHVAQHYCGEKGFDGDNPFRHAKLFRSLQFYNWRSEKNESWFPLSRDNRLGFDFAIYNCLGAEVWPAQRRSYWRGAGRRENLVALFALQEARIQDVSELSERLATPLQKQDLDTTNGMS